MEICEICGRPADCTHHLIFGFGLRRIADEDNITISLCNSCHTTGRTLDRIHDNPMAEHLSKMVGQERWEKQRIIDGATQDEAREQFIKRYGRSWL